MPVYRILSPAVSLIAVAIAATPSAVADTIVLLEQNRNTFALIQSECGGKTTDAEVAKAFEEFDSQVFTLHDCPEIPLFWLRAEVAVNPKLIQDYVFPGTIPGFYTHLEYVEPAR